MSIRKLSFGSGGPFTMDLRMKSSGKGGGRVFWANAKNQQPIFTAERTTKLEPIHDGQWHDYTLKLPTASIESLRIDPARARCESRGFASRTRTPKS